jgi:hypothetical protein
MVIGSESALEMKITAELRTKKHFVKIIEEDWPVESELKTLLLAILSQDAKELIHLTLDDLRGLLPKRPEGYKLKDLYRWCCYLASERVGLLADGWELIRENGEIAQLNPSDVANALESDTLHDPITGEPVPAWRSKTVLYYFATDLFRSLV